MTRARLAEWVGYDPRVLALMPAPERGKVAALARWCLLPCFLFGGSAVAGVWLTQKALLPALGLGCLAALFTFNLFRVVIAGGGAALHWNERRTQRWAPRLAPLVVLGLFAAGAAQPVHLLVVQSAVEPQIERHRTELIERHERGLKRLQRQEAPSNALSSAMATYEKRVAECEFVSKRLALVWQVPEAPFLFTLAFAWIALMPLILAHTFYLGALRSYELLRWRVDMRQVNQAEAETQREVARALSAWQESEPWQVAARLVGSSTGQAHG